MALGVTAEQDELRASVRRFLIDRAPLTRVRELMETEDGVDRAVWDQVGSQLGLIGLAIPEEYGGGGFTFAEQAIVLEELGAAAPDMQREPAPEFELAVDLVGLPPKPGCSLTPCRTAHAAVSRLDRTRISARSGSLRYCVSANRSSKNSSSV